MSISLKAQKRIKIIFCCIVAFPFLISLLNALLFTSGVSSIKEGHNRIEREYNKHSNYVINRINETRKMMDDLEDRMKRGRYSTELDRDIDQHEIDRKGLEIRKKYKDQYLRMFEEQKNKLENIKQQLRDSGIVDNIKEYTKFKEYKREVVNTVEMIAYILDRDDGYGLSAFKRCKKFEKEYVGSSDIRCMYIVEEREGSPISEKYIESALSHYSKLKETLGEAYLINNERERENKVQVLLKEIRSIHFAYIEKDYNVRYGSSIALSALKALFPYKDLILEILEAQKHIDAREGNDLWFDALVNRCVTKHGDINNGRRWCRGIISGTDYFFNWGKPHKKYQKYQLLDSKVESAIFIQLLKEYKDFGVKEND